MNKLKGAILALCAILLVLPCLAMPFLRSGESDPEDRYLADYPSLLDVEGGLNSGFDRDFEAWLCDHFAFRKPVLRANALLNYRLLHDCANESVVVGRGDWLYFADSVPDYTGEGRLSEAELAAICDNLARLAESLEGRGARLYIAIVPNKSTVYPGYMPARYAPRQDEGNIALLREACAGLPVTWIDLTVPLEAAAAGSLPVYYRTDTHWNALGAAIAADALLRGMGRQAPGYAIRGEAAFSEGDLARLMGASGALSEVVPDVVPEAPLPEADFSEHRLTCAGPGADRLLVYRDSFGTAVGPWLAGAFAETELRWEYPLDGTRPCDAALLLICERNLREYLLPPPELGDDEALQANPSADDGEDEDYVEIDGDDDFFANGGEDEEYVEIDGDDDFFADGGEDEEYVEIDGDDDFFADGGEDEEYVEIDGDDDFFADGDEDEEYVEIDGDDNFFADGDEDEAEGGSADGI